jgi:hypothetical protein
MFVIGLPEGDLEYDGTPYYPDWQNSTKARFPSPFLRQQPTTAGGYRYGQIQFMTDASATEFNTNCDLLTGSGCVLPPKGPQVTSTRSSLRRGSAAGAYGNSGTCPTAMTSGGWPRYGSVGPRTLGAFLGPVLPNSGCRN